jgi:capsular exopolysaccharide synthesis family protein
MARRATEAIPEIIRLDDTESQKLANAKRLNERVTKALPDEEHALEPQIRHLQPRQMMLRPAREVELTLARLDPHLFAVHELDPRAVAQFNRLAIAMISGAARQPLKRVLLTSVHHGEGRTCVTLNLAAALARAKQRVLVIDTDLQRPSVSRLLGIDSEVGLAEAVSLGLPPEKAVLRITPADFHVLPTRGQVDNSAELLASPSFASLLNSLDLCYDFILFDSAPLIASSDANLIGLHSQATLLVVRPGKTSASEMGKSISMLDEESLFGVVMNRVSN